MQFPSFSCLALILAAFSLSASAAPATAKCASVACKIVNGVEVCIPCGGAVESWLRGMTRRVGVELAQSHYRRSIGGTHFVGVTRRFATVLVRRRWVPCKWHTPGGNDHPPGLFTPHSFIRDVLKLLMKEKRVDVHSL
ncbi:hypothetical protein DFH08DRAFT_812315 [Mycena albidolilacea]|uniref:Secreted protein n=1 Tax=Mycena albidolilacea TaxID=1033008 RepID=A0AAD6ZUH3_9AGAR|nr:hypothetical protein DFH08DRAFT_812315 [Mycena albidolilacea]